MENKAKTTIFNLIVLDESGSMCDLTKSTIDGCNETLNTIRAKQKAHTDTQRYLVSIFVFQSGNPASPSRYIIKNKPIDDVKNITTSDYKPWGGTPLLDAVGSTLVDLRAVASTHEDAIGAVTIITDGYENSSVEYNWEQVANLIGALKEQGWLFNFIGANIDVDAVSKRMNIDNALKFKASKQGTGVMFNSLAVAFDEWDDDRVRCEEAAPEMSHEERIKSRIHRAKGFFGK